MYKNVVGYIIVTTNKQGCCTFQLRFILQVPAIFMYSFIRTAYCTRLTLHLKGHVIAAMNEFTVMTETFYSLIVPD